ncbi:hypothetical protein FBU30_010027 [Linnemannia zychae]|nr:hypothetical protein FBU30_010027 [Linnemannia zychae]
MKYIIKDNHYIAVLTHLTIKVFNHRPSGHEKYAAQYIARMCKSPVPSPNVKGFVDFFSIEYPSAFQSSIARTWNKLKDHFSNENNIDFADIQDHINVNGLISAFAAAPRMSEASSVSSNMSSQSRSAPIRITRTRGSSGENSSSNSSTGKSSSSGSQLSTETVLKMRTLFQKNFEAYDGDAWELPSGATLDDLLAAQIEALPYESSLHSFVIEDAKSTMQLAADEKDRVLLKKVLVDRSEEHLPGLTEPETEFLKKYNLPPTDLWKLLATSGWQTIGSDLETKPDEDFQRIVHTALLDLLTAYQQVGMEIPTGSTESWYMHVLWHFLGALLSCPRRLEYQPGEVHSSASSHRRNKIRTRDGRQYIGHKADGIVVSKLSRFELCAIEAAKKENGPNGTKALDDVRKLAKMTKDMHDKIREVATVVIRDRLLTFSIRISALTMTLYTMRQRPGRFYQMCIESSASFPSMWTEENTTVILGVLERILVFRKAMIEMGRQVPQWVSVSIGSSNSDAQEDYRAATMTSPHLIPFIDSATLEAVPELGL